MFCSRGPKHQIQTPESGEGLKSQPQNKGSKSLAHRWAMKISWHGILLRRIPIVPDVCLASAPPLCVDESQLCLSGPWILPRLTIKKCGSVCAAFWRCLFERTTLPIALGGLVEER